MSNDIKSLVDQFIEKAKICTSRDFTSEELRDLDRLLNKINHEVGLVIMEDELA